MNQQITGMPWHMGLEAWCAQHWGTAHQKTGTVAAQWAPYEAHKPERFYQVPTVLVVLSSNTRYLHQGFVTAVELLRTSTSGFKPVLVTDMYRSPAMEVCQWPIEQVIDETLWLRQSAGNWLDYAAGQVIAAQQFYAASYVVSPTTLAQARSWVNALAQAYNVLDAVRDSALEALASRVEPERHSGGFRSGWQQLAGTQQGQTVSRTFTDYDDAGTLTAQIRAGGSGVLLAAGELADPALLAGAAQAGWATVVLETGEQPPSAHFLAGAVRACADALREDGRCPDGHGSGGYRSGGHSSDGHCSDGHRFASASSWAPVVLTALPTGWPSIADAAGTLTHDDAAEPWTLRLPGVGTLEFTTDETPVVLAGLSTVSR